MDWKPKQGLKGKTSDPAIMKTSFLHTGMMGCAHAPKAKLE